MGVKTKPETLLKEINRGNVDPKRMDANEEFQWRMRRNNAINYIGLLDRAIYMLTEFDDVREHYAHKFRYVHLDEMNDTSRRDYSIAKLVAGEHKNFFAVGDLSQTIYTFRGSDRRSIEYLKADFPNHEEFRLSISYRCTEEIIACCNNLLPENNMTALKNGDAVEAIGYEDEDAEALGIAKGIRDLVSSGMWSYGDFAILCRMHSIAETMVLAMREIPYTRAGSKRELLNEEEVRVFHDYLRVLHNGQDDPSFQRIMNVPRREIRRVTMARIVSQAREAGISILESTLIHFQDSPDEEKQWLVDLREMSKEDFPTQCRSIYTMLKDWYGGQGLKTRVLYLDLLLIKIAEWQNTTPYEITTENYLHYLTEVTSQDDVAEEEEKDTVKILTVHTAKGLEFPVVVVPGCENMVFPMNRRAETEAQKASLDEERRLFYVALSRAKELARFTFSKRRLMRGKDRDQKPSVFLEEAGIPIEMVSGSPRATT
jgi:DNA helicase-2/ATP-dependent DNA helicase PcrA